MSNCFTEVSDVGFDASNASGTRTPPAFQRRVVKVQPKLLKESEPDMPKSSRLPALVLASLLATTVTSHASELLVLTEDVPAGLDIDGPSFPIPTTEEGMVQLFEPLLAYAKKPAVGGGLATPDFTKPEGRLAESWSFDAPSLTWTFHLRHGVKSCAGNAFTADDVIYTWARGKSVSGTIPNSWFLLNMGSVANFSSAVFDPDPAKAAAARKLGDEITKVDDYTIKVRQAESNPLFLVNLAVTVSQGIYDKTEMEKHTTPTDPWSHAYSNNVDAPSFGPYCLNKWVKSDMISFKANPNYYRGKAAIDQIVMKRVPQMIQTMTAHQYSSLEGQKSVTVGGTYGNTSLFMLMNFKTKPFDNIKLRQAIAYAIPYDRIIQVGYAGQAQQWKGVVPSIFPSFVSSNAYHYDPDKAKAMLAEAGFPGGKGLDKFPDSFKIGYAAEKEATLGPVVNVIRTALQDVGVPATLDPMPQTQYNDHMIVKKDLAFAVNDSDRPIGVDVGYAMQLFFVSTAAGGMDNMTNYANPHIDALWSKVQVELDKTKRDAELVEMQTIAMHDVAWLPIVEFKNQYAYSSTLKGLTWYPDNAPQFYDLHY
jgi:peptide/nickel transport system substrate-binding protein